MIANQKSTLRRYVGFYCPSVYAIASRFDKAHPGILRRRPALHVSDRLKMIEQHGSFDSNDLMSFLSQQGVCAGDVVMLHCSWNDLTTFKDNQIGLIRGLQELLGAQGTLCMPTFYDVDRHDRTKPFDVVRSPSTTGVVSELFRRMKNVRRSIQLRSVAACGPAAEFLVDDHHLSPYACSEVSPYARFSEVEAWVVCLGTPAVMNTMFHCAIDILPDELPVRSYPRQPSQFRFRQTDGSEAHVAAFETRQNWAYFGSGAHVAEHIGETAISTHSFHGVTCSLTKAALFLPRLLELARAGIHIYSRYC